MGVGLALPPPPKRLGRLRKPSKEVRPQGRAGPSGGGFPFSLSRAYRVGGVVLENCVVVLAGLVVPSETREHGLQRLLTDPRPPSR